MALMTPAERKAYQGQGYFFKNRCDNEACKKPIRGIIYAGTRGEYCSRGCIMQCEDPGHKTDKERVTMKTNEADETSKKKKKKKVKAAEAEAPAKKKKKKSAESEEAPAKKKKKKRDDDDDEPKKSKRNGAGGPFLPSSSIGQLFQACLDGTTMPKLEKLAEKLEVDLPGRLVHIKKGAKGDFKWKFIHREDSDRVKVVMK
jgi:hypothetical protein